MHLRHFAAATAMLVFSLAAHADSFLFSFSGKTFSGSGVISGNLNGSGQYLITSVSGTTDTGNGTNRTISGILAAGTFGGNDNLLFVSSTGLYSFDGLGLSYQLANGAQINLYNLSNEALERTNGNVVQQISPITITATPEPSSLALLGTGALGVIGAVRRRMAA